MKHLFILILGLSISSFGFATESRPNIILVLVDDMGWMDLSCQGSDYYKTPAIDQLAKDGIRFTNGYAACAVCSPTRAAVQTGRHPHRIGITDWIRSRFQRGKLGTPDKNPTKYTGGKNQQLLCPPNPYWMEHSEITIAEILKENGYATGYIGKWHLGDPDWYPPAQGYTENRGGCDYGQPPSFFDPYNQPKGRHETLRERDSTASRAAKERRVPDPPRGGRGGSPHPPVARREEALLPTGRALRGAHPHPGHRGGRREVQAGGQEGCPCPLRRDGGVGR